MRVSFLYIALSCLHAYFQLCLTQELDGTFIELTPTWQSEQSQNPSLVSKPELNFINDTAATLVWTLTTTDLVARLATNFEVELASGHFSDDFVTNANVQVKIPDLYSNLSFVDTYTIVGLAPDSKYRTRVCPVFGAGRGDCSPPLAFTTLSVSVNYWEPVMPRRLSMAASGRGFTNQVLQRPHLEPGVEVFGEDATVNNARFSDPVTSETPVIPSGRRGHSLSLVDQTVYMFGGRTNGKKNVAMYVCPNILSM
jgi:hypothetical protein